MKGKYVGLKGRNMDGGKESEKEVRMKNRRRKKEIMGGKEQEAEGGNNK